MIFKPENIIQKLSANAVKVYYYWILSKTAVETRTIEFVLKLTNLPNVAIM